MNTLPIVSSGLGFSVLPPFQYTIGAAAVEIYNSTKEKRLGKLVVTNVGLNPVKYAYNTDVTTAVYHGIIPGGNAAEDGSGGILQIEREDLYHDTMSGIKSVSLYSDDGSDVVVQKFQRTDVI